MVLSRYFKLVIGYFVYNAARETAVTIHDFLNYVDGIEDSDVCDFTYHGGPSYG